MTFSLRRALAGMTLLALWLGTMSAAWSWSAETGWFLQLVFSLFCALLVTLPALAAAAALDPWLPCPRRLQSAARKLPLRTGWLSIALSLLLVPPVLLFASLPALLVVSQWDGETSRTLSEIGWGYATVVYAAVGGGFLGAATGLLLGLYAGSPVGPRGGLVLACGLAGLPLLLLFPLASLWPVLYGVAGLVLLLLAGAVGWCLPGKGAGFAGRSRRWSGRAALLGAALGALLPWLVLGRAAAIDWSLLLGAGGIAGYFLAGLLAALVTAERGARASDVAA